MLSTCNNVCLGGLTLTKTDQCDIYQRTEIPVRLIIATCDTAFPTGVYTDSAHATAFLALITSSNVSATFELTDFAWADPTTTTKAYRPRNYPPDTIITGRTLTARDFNATDFDSAGAASAYEDRLFYKNIIQNKATKVRGYVTDTGKIYLFLTPNGEFMSYSMTEWIGFDTDVEGKNVEFKNYAINFVGDPLRQITTPYLDIVAAGAQATLGWLYLAN